MTKTSKTTIKNGITKTNHGGGVFSYGYSVARRMPGTEREAAPADDPGRQMPWKRQTFTASKFATRAEAVTALAKLDAELKAGTMKTNTRAATFGSIMDAWLERAKVQTTPTLTPSTIAAYSDSIGRLKHVLGDLVIEDTTPDTVERKLRELAATGGKHKGTGEYGQPLSATTCASAFRVMRTAIRWAVKNDRCHQNALKLVANVAAPTADVRTVEQWTPAQFDAFWKVCEDALAGDDTLLHAPAFAYLLASVTGLRRGELAGLQWSDVCVDGGCDADAKAGQHHVHVRRSRARVQGEVIEGAPKSNDSARIIPLLSERHAVWVRQYRSLQAAERQAHEDAGRIWHGDDYVLCHPSNSRPGRSKADRDASPVATQPLNPQTLTTTLAKILKRAGLAKMPLHGLRHVHASFVVNYDVMSLGQLALRLGHADPSITAKVYARADLNAVNVTAAADAFAAASQPRLVAVA